MRTVTVFYLTIALHCLLTAAEDNTHCHLDHCSCLRSLNTIHANCSALNITAVPQFHSSTNTINTNVTLNLTFNHIKTIGNHDFTSYNLIILNASYNLIENVRAFAFDGQKYLLIVDLSHNRIARFDQFVFSPVSKSLNLSHNFLNSTSFKSLISNGISHLDISSNNITHISSEFSSEMASLIHLDLSGNPLTYLDALTLSNLTAVNLQGTPLQDTIDALYLLSSSSGSDSAVEVTEKDGVKHNRTSCNTLGGGGKSCSCSNIIIGFSTVVIGLVSMIIYYVLVICDIVRAPDWLTGARSDAVAYNDIPASGQEAASDQKSKHKSKTKLLWGKRKGRG